MKFEIGKRYRIDRQAMEYEQGHEYLCVHITPCSRGILSVYKANGQYSHTMQFTLKERIKFKEIKQPRTFETKTEWYAAVNFDLNPETYNVQDVIAGITTVKFQKYQSLAKDDADDYTPSLAKIEITAKVTEILEDEKI